MSAILQVIGTRIREFQIEDLESVVEIDQCCFRPSWDAYEFLRRLRSERIIATVLERKGRILGFCVHERFAGYLIIRRLAVRQKKCGFGTALVKDCVRRVLKDGLQFLDVRVPEDNLASQLFFAAVGFTAIDVIPSDEGNEYLFRQLRGGSGK